MGEILDGVSPDYLRPPYSDACMEKVSAKGKVTCYLQAVGTAIVHPDFKRVFRCALKSSGNYFRIVYNPQLDKSSQDPVDHLCRILGGQTPQEKILHFGWVTDFEVTGENGCQFMRGTLARWKIENETFNNLKNQGYQFGHNFGLGKQYLNS